MEAESGSLSRSAHKVLQFAGAGAQERTGLPASSTPVDSWDLLIGVLLSHLGDSEAKQTFRHFGLAAGQALPDTYPRLTPDGLNSRLSTMPADYMPRLTEEARNIVNKALRTGAAASSDGITPLRSLWLALLEGVMDFGRQG